MKNNRMSENAPGSPQKEWPPAAGQPDIEAIYQAGNFVPQTPLHLPDGSRIHLQLILPDPGTTAAEPDQPLKAGPQVRSIEAVYHDNLIQLFEPLDLPYGALIRLHMVLQVTMLAVLPSDPFPAEAGVTGSRPDRLQKDVIPSAVLAAAAPLEKAARKRRAALWQDRWQGFQAALAQPLRHNGLLTVLTRLDGLLLTLVMLVYLLVRLVGLTSFPIFFFSDEAIHANQGQALIQNRLRDEKGIFLPPYFRNADKWNLSLSVYLHGASASLFGKSVWISRATSAGVTLLAGIAVALLLRLVFKLRFWWVGPLVLSVIPVWFLHSRTAFEVVLMVSFYACFLCAYLFYRYFHPRYLIVAMVFGAATVYCYTGGQGIMLLSGVLLLVSDFRYHQRVLHEHPRLTNGALMTLVLVAVPYLRFRYLYPDAMTEHLRVMNSIWIRDVPIAEKLNNFKDLYLLGLNPTFWFSPNNGVDLSRHTIKDWGNIPLVFFPLMLIGLWICLRQWRESAHRVVLISILAAPFTAALAQIQNYRVLVMVIPVAILVSLGIDGLAGWMFSKRIAGRNPAFGVGLALGCAIWLVSMNFVMLRTALVYGPTWYSDFGLYGQQYGAMQLFPIIAEELQSVESTNLIISPDWANNPDEFVPFFLPENLQDRIKFLSPHDYLTWKHEFSSDTLFVLPAYDYELVRASGKMVVDPPLRVLPYPNGQPGFYFVRMHYIDRIDKILEAEREVRLILTEASVVMDGKLVPMKHSLLDLGAPSDLFDNDHHTLIRGFEANPFVLEFEFPEPRLIQAIDLDIWRFNMQMTVTVVTPNNGQRKTFKEVYRDLPEDPHIHFTLSDGPVLAGMLRIELLDMNARDRAKVHITDLGLR